MSLEMLQGSKRKNSLKENMKVFPALCPGPLSSRNSSRNSFEGEKRREAIYTVAVKLELMGEILKGKKEAITRKREEKIRSGEREREREKTFFQGPSKVFPLISLQHPQHFFFYFRVCHPFEKRPCSIFLFSLSIRSCLIVLRSFLRRLLQV